MSRPLTTPRDAALAALATAIDAAPADMVPRMAYADRLRELGYARLADAWEWLNREGKVPALLPPQSDPDLEAWNRNWAGYSWWYDADVGRYVADPEGCLPDRLFGDVRRAHPLSRGDPSAFSQLARAARRYAAVVLARPAAS